METLTLNFGEGGLEKFELLRRRLSTKDAEISNGQLMSAALSILDWAVGEIEYGRTVGSLNCQEKIFTELHAPPIDAIKRHVAWGTWNFNPKPPGDNPSDGEQA